MNYRSGCVLLCVAAIAVFAIQAHAQAPTRILAWSEGGAPEVVYPRGVEGAMSEVLAVEASLRVTEARLSDSSQGLSESNLAGADVLIWYGGRRSAAVTDENAERVVRHVRERGMAVIALHTACDSKPFRLLMQSVAKDKQARLSGTPGRWGGARIDARPQWVRAVDPAHPIADGIPDFVIPKSDTFLPPFNVPPADAVVFRGDHEGGPASVEEGLLWRCGRGWVFYFRPGYEGFPIYLQHEVRMILTNTLYFLAAQKTGSNP